MLNEGNANVNHSLFTNNSARNEGGAILNSFSATLDLSNVTLSHNITDSATASEFSGSALTNLSTARLNFVTVTDNIGPSAGAAIWSNAIDINNSIIANNAGSDCRIAPTSTFSTENLDSDGSCSGFTITADPLLAPLGDNGGATFTHALLPSSAAIDAASGSCVPDDQRGASRPARAACDLGAFELGGTPAPTPAALELPTANKDTLCLWGPGPEYGTVNSIPKDTEVILLGIGETNGWLIIETPVYPGVACWAPEGDFDLDPDLDLGLVPVFPNPPLPDEPPDGGDNGGDATTKPAAPSNLALSPSCGQTNTVKLNWTDNSNNEIGFRIYRDGNLIAVVPANTTNYVDQNAPDGKLNYAVEAFNSAGVSSQATMKTECP